MTYETQHQTSSIEPAAVGEAGQENTMQSLEQIVTANGTTREDIEGGSFVISDGVRVPIFTGKAGAHGVIQEGDYTTADPNTRKGWGL